MNEDQRASRPNRTRVLFATVLVGIVATLISLFMRGRGTALHSPDRQQVDAARTVPANHVADAKEWSRTANIPNPSDLIELASITLRTWSDGEVPDAYVDEILRRGASVTEQAVAWADQRRSYHLDEFPPDSEWSVMTADEKLRSRLRFDWAESSPVSAFTSTYEWWKGDANTGVRAAPPGFIQSQGITSRFLPPGMTLADTKNDKGGVWLRVRARMNGHNGEHVIDFRFIHDSRSGYWFPAEVRVHGERTEFNWAV
jgi:hypothetical protein